MADRDVVLGVGSDVAPATTTSGSDAWEISGLGWTPHGILIVPSSCDADNTLFDALQITFMTSYDGYGESSGGWETDAAGTSESSSYYYRNANVNRYQNSASSIYGSIRSRNQVSPPAGPKADGWNYEVYTAAGESKIHNFVLFGGDDAVSRTGVADQVDASDGGTRAMEHTYGSEPPNLLGFVAYIPNDTGHSYKDDLAASYGMFTYRKTDQRIQQCCVAVYSDDNVGTTDVRQTILSDRCAVSLEGGVEDHSVEFTAVSAANLTFTTRGTPTTRGHVVAQLFSLPDDVEAWCGVVDSPTDAGSDWEPTEQLFPPQFAAVFASMLQSTDSVISSTDAGHIGVGFVDDADRARSICASTVDNETTSNTGSYVDSALVRLYEADASSFTERFHLDAPASSPFTATGIAYPNASISAADSTTRKWLLACVQKPNTKNYVHMMG